MKVTKKDCHDYKIYLKEKGKVILVKRIKAYYVVFTPEQTAWALKAFHGFVFYCFLVYFQNHTELLIVI